MDRHAPPTSYREALRNGAPTPGRAAGKTDTYQVLIVNSQPGYPNRIPIARYFRDAGDAGDVKRLARVVLGCETDGLLHYAQTGTFLVMRETAQTRLWGAKADDTTPFTSLILPLNHWLQERVGILRGKRAIESRIAKSDAALDGFGYPALRGTLLGLAGKKPKTLQIFDAVGGGGILEIPPRGLLVPVQETDKPVLLEGDPEILSIEYWAQLLQPTGVLVETPTARLSDGVVEGGRARARHPRKSAIHSQHVQNVDILQQGQEQGDEKKHKEEDDEDED